MAIALHHSRAKGTAKLVLLGIANHDGDGGAWPAVKQLAKYAGVDPRNVQRAIEQLEKLHEIRRHVQAGGDHRFAPHERPNRYSFLLRCPVDCDRSSQHRMPKDAPAVLPMDDMAEGVAQASPGDATAGGGVAQASPKPSLNHPNTSEKKTHVGNRASRGACGHDLIDDRHCERGCAPARVLETA